MAHSAVEGRVWWVWVCHHVLSLTRSWPWALISVNWVIFVMASLVQNTQSTFIFPGFRIIKWENHEMILVIEKETHLPSHSLPSLPCGLLLAASLIRVSSISQLYVQLFGSRW